MKPALPFEFVVPGPPVSAQAKPRQRLAAWKRTVRRAAAAKWPKRRRPEKGALRISVCYYHDRVTVRLDNDNVVKPIQDALAGLAFDDDSQVTDTVLRKTCLDGAFRVRGVSSTLWMGFRGGREFLHIVIDKAPDHQVLLT